MGQTGITQSQSLNASEGPIHARYGPGQYLTDIPPEQIGGTTLADLTQDQIDDGQISLSQLSRTLYGRPFGMSGKLATYLEIDVTGLPVENPSTNIFRIPGTDPLDLTGRIIRFGPTPFGP